jgi:hypothetical protein
MGVALVGVGVGCVGEGSNGAVWAARNLDAERAMFQLGDARRAQMAQSFELGLADETLGAEQQRVQALLQGCPGQRSAFAPSRGNTLRDSVRIRAQGDPARIQAVADVALADWFSRRASATGNAAYCAQAQAALNGTAQTPPPTNLLANIPAATVARDPNAKPVPIDGGTLSNYALGYLDAVSGAAPLPQYLAVVYGGSLRNAQPTTDADSAARLVDVQAAAYPQWEPDALYAALRGGSWP